MAIRFTTKAVIMDGIRFKAVYELTENETLKITMTSPENAKTELILEKGRPEYIAARAAYDEKAAKRAAGKIDPESYAGIKLQGGWFTISYEKDIDRCIVKFSKKPAPEIREIVKAYGFWWTPSQKCWSRRLNNGSWFAGQELYKKLTA